MVISFADELPFAAHHRLMLSSTIKFSGTAASHLRPADPAQAKGKSHLFSNTYRNVPLESNTCKVNKNKSFISHTCKNRKRKFSSQQRTERSATSGARLTGSPLKSNLHGPNFSLRPGQRRHRGNRRPLPRGGPGPQPSWQGCRCHPPRAHRAS